MLTKSSLFDQDTFYAAFLKDVGNCKKELIIESPFITSRRISLLLPNFKVLRQRGVNIILNTKEPEEHDIVVMRPQAEDSIEQLQALGVTVLFTGGHHRKLAIIDRKVLWEGSLNILSQSNSCEVMRRIQSKRLARQMASFISLNNFVN